MATNIDQLQIEVATKSDGAVKGLQELKKALSSLKRLGKSTELDDLATKLEKISNIRFDNLKQLNRLGDTLKQVKRLTKDVGDLKKKMSNIPDTISVGADTGSIVDAIGDIDSVSSTMDDIPAKTKPIQGALDKTGEKFKKLGNEAHKSTKKARGGLMQLFKIVAVYGTAFRLWSAFTTGIGEGLKNIAGFNKETSAAMSKLSTMALQLKNSIGAALYPVIVAMTPALQAMANAIIKALNAFNQFVAVLSGKSTYIRAKEYLKEYGDTAKKTANTIKKSFAGMDEITVIGDKGGGSSDSGDNPADMFEEVEIDNSFMDSLDKILARVLEIGAGFLAWELSKKFLGSLGALFVSLGLGLVIDSIREVITDGLSWESVIKGAIGGALVGAGIGFKLGGPMGALLGATIGVGVTLVIQGITSMISEGVNVENVLSTIVGALTSIGGIVAVVKLFNKKNAASTPEFDMASDTIDDVSSNTSGLTSKLKSLVKNLALGIVIIAEVAIAAGIIVGAIWGLGVLLEQVGKAWQPVLDNGGTIAAAMGIGVALLVVIGAATAGLGMLGTALITPLALGLAILALLGVSAALFLAEIILVGVLLNQVGIAWQPVLDNGENIEKAILIGTGLLIAIGVVAAALGVATVASAGLLPLAIGLGTALLVELAAAFVLFCDSLIDVAKKLVELSYPLDELNAILPGLEEDMDDFTDFMGAFAGAVVKFTAASAIAGIAATIDKVIDFFTTDPVQRMYDEVTEQTEDFEDLIPALEKINPLIKRATELVGTYKDNMGSFESATGGSGGFLNSIVNGAKGVINGMISLFEGMVNGIIKGVNSLIRGLNKISIKLPDWAGGKEFGINIKEISQITLPRFQSGGFPEDGLFMANHSELVGKFSNGKTAVANNEQIVDGIATGVYTANQEQNGLLREQNNLLRQLVDKRSGGQIDVTTITSAMQRKNRRDGKTIVPVGI